ncbi:hypothetical protein CISIN_1g043066mg [Citrus sinensis]|uniref:Uncharacterized protein n=1 Tax=Citrus sinensis TaxID=2711 RepID=A0A067G3Z7_CITSI|nr:hypothetical protein CISIN_1g043066mg [Citrus sinensis]
MLGLALCLYLMRDILAVSNALSQALQRKDQDILNAIKLVEICMKNLQMMRDVWDSLLYEISSFCLKYDIDVPNMNDVFLLESTTLLKDKVYPLVYLLVTLSLVPPISTTTVERTFSVMKFIKNELQNEMGDEWMNDNLIVFIEKMYLIVLIRIRRTMI